MNRQYGALSGLAILLIVMNHAIHFGVMVYPVQGGWLYVLSLLESLGIFAVPAFLFISGAFVSYSAAQLTPAFIKGSVSRILWPYVIWSLTFFVLEFLVTGVRQSPAGYVKNLLVGYPYHFVPLLIFWYLASPLAVKLGRQHGLAVVLIIGALQALLILERYPRMFGPERLLPEWTSIMRIPVLFTSMSDWAVFFPLGLVFSIHEKTLKPKVHRVWWMLIAATVVLFALGVLELSACRGRARSRRCRWSSCCHLSAAIRSRSSASSRCWGGAATASISRTSSPSTRPCSSPRNSLPQSPA